MIAVDASIIAAWLLPDESDPLADAAIDRLRIETGIVPVLWRYEVHNLLVTAVRRARIGADDARMIKANLDELPVLFDSDLSEGRAMAIALEHRLSFYDACYLELAQRLGLVLATLDRQLAQAAIASRVRLFGSET